MNSQPPAEFSPYLLRQRLFPTPRRRDPILWILGIVLLSACGGGTYLVLSTLDGWQHLVLTLGVLAGSAVVIFFSTLLLLRVVGRWRMRHEDELSASIVSGGRGLRADGDRPEPAVQSWDSHMEIIALLDEEDEEEAEQPSPTSAQDPARTEPVMPADDDLIAAPRLQLTKHQVDSVRYRPTEAPELWLASADQQSVLYGQPVLVRWGASDADYVTVEGVEGKMPIEGTIEVLLRKSQSVAISAHNRAGINTQRTPVIDVATPERVMSVSVPAPTIELSQTLVQLPGRFTPDLSTPPAAPKLGRLLRVVAPPEEITKMIQEITDQRPSQGSDTLETTVHSGRGSDEGVHDGDKA